MTIPFSGRHNVEWYVAKTVRSIRRTEVVTQCVYFPVAHKTGVGYTLDRCSRFFRDRIEGYPFCRQHATIVKREMAEARKRL